MYREKQVQLLNESIDSLLEPVSEIHDLFSLLATVSRIKIPVDQDNDRSQPWSLLPLRICESISGDYKKAIPAAAMLQLLNAAAELFDDVEDADFSEAILAVRNPAVAVNAATALVVLAQKAITQFKSFGVADNTAIAITDTVNSYYAKASSGQHLDLVSSPEDKLSEEKYLQTTYMKSACTIECACHVGALAANANASIVERFCDFGRNLGMAAQIANDIQGIIDGRDITGRNLTLPVLFAMNQVKQTSLDILVKVYVKSKDTEPDVERVKEILYDCGAVQYAVIQMQLYKQLAREIMPDLEKNRINTDLIQEYLK